MNRNILKIIALISMVLDHVGLFLMDNFLPFRIIGRIAFPIFAFFIAEGWKYTRSKKKYILLILLFAIISQIPFILLFDNLFLNVLFLFLLALIMIYCLDNFDKHSIIMTTIVTFTIIISIFLTALNLIDGDGIFGILLILAMYYVKNRKLAIVLCSTIILATLGIKILINPKSIFNIIKLVSLLSFVFIALYNNKKGKLNLKYLFYIFYPAHLIAIYIIQLCI